jgi:hypothetical protein
MMPTENERICDMIPEAETCDQALDMIYDKHFIVRLPSQSLQRRICLPETDGL